MTVDTASMRTGHLSYSLASPATVPRSSLHSPPSKNHSALPMATITLHFGHCTCICLPCAQNRRISSHNLSEFGQESCQKETKVDPWEKPQRGSSPTAAFPGNSKFGWYLNRAGVPRVEHPVPKMESV